MTTIRIGLLVAQEGAAGLWGPSAQACAELAIAEINAERGLRGRQAELLVINAGSTGRSAAEAAREAVAEEGVAAIVGMLPSYARSPVAFAINERVPFIYTPQFEGFEGDNRIVTTGETSAELLRPALTWLSEKKRARKFFLCGSDYIWPRSTCAVAREIVRGLGGQVVGEMFVRLEEDDYEPVLDAVRASGADVVLPYFLGNDQIRFNRAFADAGLHETTLRFTSAIDETIVYGLSENATENLFASSAYFSSIRSNNNGAFLERYHTLHGDCPPPVNSFGQSCYEGVHCLAALVASAGSLDPRSLHKAVGKTRQVRTARGGTLAGGRHPIHFARLDGYDFNILQGI